MTGITTYRTEKGNSAGLMNELIGVFKSNVPTTTNPWFTTIGSRLSATEEEIELLESTADIDPLLTKLDDRVFNNTGVKPTPPQKFRIMFRGFKNPAGTITELRVYWGTAAQMPSANSSKIDPGTPYITLWDDSCYPQDFVSVYSYRITIVPRGFAMMLWKNDQPNVLKPGNTMLVIQRPVQPGGTDAGKYREDGRIPIFALDVQAGRPVGEEIMFSVVREEDRNAATPQRGVGKPSYFNLYGLNMGWNTPNILSNYTHVIRIPFGLCTERHIYMEEMDLIAMTQATCFILDQTAELSMYAQAREYTATFGLVDYGYQETQQVLGGVRLNILTAIDKGNAAGPNFITVV